MESAVSASVNWHTKDRSRELRKPAGKPNANTAKHDTVDVPASKMKLAIANILLDEGYIAKYDLVEDGHFQTIHITLKYGADKNEKVITGLKRISKPGLRVYANTEDIPRVLGGLGTAIISTHRGAKAAPPKI